MTKTLVVVQARTGSTRLSGKVLKPLAGRPMLACQLERIQAATTPFDTVVATTTKSADTPIAELCRDLGVRCFRGHPSDLLDRHVQAARSLNADVVVKIPSDCPLIDPAVIDRVLDAWLRRSGQLDFISNLHPATYPDGNDVEVMSMDALEQAWREASNAHEREHTTPFLWENPHRFRVANVPWETGLNYSTSYRFTVDYFEDYAFVAVVYEMLYSPWRPVFSLAEILGLLKEYPHLRRINSQYLGRGWYQDYLTRCQRLPTRLLPQDVVR